MAEVLEVQKRERTGSGATRKLRRGGHVPVVLYGHGEQNEHLAIPAAQVTTLIRRHSKTVELTGDVKDTALVSQIQWDPLGIEVLHMDLVRVNLKELVDVTVPVQTHGDPVGLREGGILIENTHEVEIRCPAGSIPENLRLNITELHMGGHMTASDLELPEGIELVTAAETVIAHIEEPRAELEPEAAAEGEGPEPEIIAKGGEKAEGEEE